MNKTVVVTTKQNNVLCNATPAELQGACDGRRTDWHAFFFGLSESKNNLESKRTKREVCNTLSPAQPLPYVARDQIELVVGMTAVILFCCVVSLYIGLREVRVRCGSAGAA